MRPKYVLLHTPGPAEVVPAVTFTTDVDLLARFVRVPRSFVCAHGGVHWTILVTIRHRVIESAHQPLEVWRTVVGFYEDDPRARA